MLEKIIRRNNNIRNIECRKCIPRINHEQFHKSNIAAIAIKRTIMVFFDGPIFVDSAVGKGVGNVIGGGGGGLPGVTVAYKKHITIISFIK